MVHITPGIAFWGQRVKKRIEYCCHFCIISNNKTQISKIKQTIIFYITVILCFHFSTAGLMSIMSLFLSPWRFTGRTPPHLHTLFWGYTRK